ncbi:MAG: thioredoxin domain-containing protein [Deltaproteobacteria bacterium]|nr:thioredoxin domain-containing protein [Deltaproteobacteria bacterium]
MKPSHSTFYRNLLIAALLFSLAGIGVSLFLVQHHFMALKTGNLDLSQCNLGGNFNCDIPLMSRYSVFAGIPMAGLGFLYYLYIALTAIGALVVSENRPALLVPPTIVSVLAMLMTFYLIYVSSLVLEAYCIFCISMYILNLLITVGLLMILYPDRLQWRETMKKIPWLGSILAFILIFGIGGFIFFSKQQSLAQSSQLPPPEQIIAAFFNQPKINIPTDNRPTWGNPNAKITIAEFSDFECPFCKRAALTLKPFLTEYKNAVKFVFLNYPLDQACNPFLKKPLHTLACQAAYSSHCAHMQGKFWPYHDLIFANQKLLTSESFNAFAKQLSLNFAQFQSCLSSEDTKNAILRDLQAGDVAQISGTPSIFINGRPFGFWPYAPIFHQLLQEVKKNPSR